MKNSFLKIRLFAIITMAFLYGCSEDDDNSLPSLPEGNNAEFSYETDPEDPFTVHFNNESQQYDASYWRFGDDSGFSTEDSPTHTFPNGGLFEVILAVQGDGNGGEVRRMVEIIDPALQGERIEDGNFQDPNAWNVQEAGYEILTDVSFTEAGLHLSNEGEGVTTNVVVWQEIQVEAGKEYHFSADVAGGGMNQAWLEFHFSNEEPEGDDYAENNLWSLNAYAECGIDPFEGDIVDLSCSGDGAADGIFTFEEGGTAYIVIKSGSYEGYLGPEGITISNVSLMPVDDME
ncbi:PKD domain-containing protein [Autumnicola musiva]|uniref:PKD domain-containing protein n=1 Tax=Autumnicola musiva TaxID=3075589 RepID=A0ABU3D7S2_9FLAO|nr:PKD domain-containing protein [Zunongwangia sp. F117]MDT0677581.1 PKD domain-containing protein [Zunongwangia sp. F117]